MESKDEFYRPHPPKRMKRGGLIAPNGKPSNLTPEQYKIVRSESFKAWFGDWENDPANASKVVDSNGEPLVVYHGGQTKFNIFSPYSQGHYFTDNIKYAKAFTEKSDDGHLFKCFINVRNYLDARKLSELTPSFEINEKQLIMFFKKNGIYSKEMEKSIKDFFKKQYLKKTFWSYLNNYGIDIPSSYKEIYDAIFLNEHSLNGIKINVYFVHESNQIKLADGTNTTFDGNNPDIRYAGGGEARPFKDDGNKLVVFNQYRNYTPYKIAVDDVNNAEYITLWKTDTDTGKDKKMGYLRLNNSGDDFLSVSEISIDRGSKGLGLGLEMYKVALKYSSDKIKGIKSYLPNRTNKKQIPKIYKKLNSVKDGDYEFIYKENNPDIRYTGGGNLK
jgi:hypothetical protein